MYVIMAKQQYSSIHADKTPTHFYIEKVLYRTLKGSISATYLEPLKRFYTLLKKGFLWVLYRTLGFRT